MLKNTLMCFGVLALCFLFTWGFSSLSKKATGPAVVLWNAVGTLTNPVFWVVGVGLCVLAVRFG
jgi:hypothetical protein